MAGAGFFLNEGIEHSKFEMLTHLWLRCRQGKFGRLVRRVEHFKGVNVLDIALHLLQSKRKKFEKLEQIIRAGLT